MLKMNVPKLGEKYLGIKWHEKEQKEGLKLYKRIKLLIMKGNYSFEYGIIDYMEE